MMEESKVIGWLSWGEKRIPLEGRLLSILWELGQIQGEINTLPRGEIKISWKDEDVRLALEKYRAWHIRLKRGEEK